MVEKKTCIRGLVKADSETKRNKKYISKVPMKQAKIVKSLVKKR